MWCKDMLVYGELKYDNRQDFKKSPITSQQQSTAKHEVM